MFSGLRADIYPLLSECLTCSKILPTKITVCPLCGRQDPTGYETRREYDFQTILEKYFKRMFMYIAFMFVVVMITFLVTSYRINWTNFLNWQASQFLFWCHRRCLLTYTWHSICSSQIVKLETVIYMEHENDKTKLRPSHLTTANYVNNHLLDRVRYLQKSEPTLVQPLFNEDDKNVFIKLSAIDLVS